jgi:hypothetical protein
MTTYINQINNQKVVSGFSAVIPYLRYINIIVKIRICVGFRPPTQHLPSFGGNDETLRS